jgi:hypothetical protein
MYSLVYIELLCHPPEVNSESNFFEDASLKSTIEEKGRNRGLRDMQVMKSFKSISKL